MTWSGPQITEMVSILGRHDSVVSAREEMARRFGLAVSDNALRNLFERRGMATPGSYLRTPSQHARHVAAAARVDAEATRTGWPAPKIDAEDERIVDEMVERATGPVRPMRPVDSARWPAAAQVLADTEPPPPCRAFVDVRPERVSPVSAGSILLVPDTHVPYEDAGAWRLLLAVARELKPEVIVVLGDFADCYSVSFHDKSPGRASRIVGELGTVAERLRELEAAAPSAKRVYIEGNHENRLARYVARQAAALHGLPGTTLPEILDLHARGWTWVPYHEHYRIGDLSLTHDVGRAGVTAVRQSRLAFGSSLAIGHVHRMAIEHERTVDGHHRVGASFGWLGDIEAVDYRHRSLARREWAHGCGIGYLDPSGHVHLQAVPFVGGRAWVAGALVGIGEEEL